MGFIETMLNYATPFLENPQIVYFLMLLLIILDSYNAYNMNNETKEYNNPLNAGEYYIVHYPTKLQVINPTEVLCSKSSTFFIQNYFNDIAGWKKANSEEISKYCGNFDCENDIFGRTSFCTNEPKVYGNFGTLFNVGLGSIGLLFGNEALQNTKVESWQLLIFMVMIPLLMWGLTASTQSG